MYKSLVIIKHKHNKFKRSLSPHNHETPIHSAPTKPASPSPTPPHKTQPPYTFLLSYFPASASASHTAFKSSLNASHPFLVFSLNPAPLPTTCSPISNQPSAPVNTSSCANAVAPGVVSDGWNENECVPVKIKGSEPVQEKSSGALVWGCVSFAGSAGGGRGGGPAPGRCR